MLAINAVFARATLYLKCWLSGEGRTQDCRVQYGMTSYLISGCFRGVYLRSCCYQLTIQCWRSALLRPASSAFHLPRFFSVSPRSTKESSTAVQGTSSELFLPDETFNDDPSALSSSVLENINQSTAGFQPVDLSSLGLCSYWPTGWIQYILEEMFNHTHLPWWGCIMTLTIVMRVLMLPLAVKMRQISSKMHLISKDIGSLHQKVAESQALGNKVESYMAQVDMWKIYKRHNVSPLSMFPVLLPQIAVFLSIFRGLRGITGAPVDGLKTGGTLWFPDLLVCDPFYILPVVSSVVFLTNLELGSEGADNDLSRKMKFYLRVAGVCIIPIVASFPSGIQVYFVTNSLCSLAQIMLFKYPTVKRYFNVPDAKGGYEF